VRSCDLLSQFQNSKKENHFSKKMVHVLLLLLVFIVSTCKSDITIGDATLQATVHTSSCDEDFGKITSLKRLDEGIEVSETQNYVWSVTVVESGGPVQITSANINQSKVTCNVVSPSSKYLSLKWNDVRENLNLILNLTINEGVLAYELGFEKVSDTNPISIWEYTLVPLRAKISSDSKVFDNVGFGVRVLFEGESPNISLFLSSNVLRLTNSVHNTFERRLFKIPGTFRTHTRNLHYSFKVLLEVRRQHTLAFMIPTRPRKRFK